jgi:hypothetical protein
MPHTSSKDLAIIEALELSNDLQSPAPEAPFSNIFTAQLQALRQLSDIFSSGTFIWNCTTCTPSDAKLLTIQEHCSTGL